MKEDPEYLQNQSRDLHRRYRWNRKFLRYGLILWATFMLAYTGAALLDIIANLDWGYTSKDVWVGLGMMVFAGFIWLFSGVIMSLVMTMGRRLYGPAPDEHEAR